MLRKKIKIGKRKKNGFILFVLRVTAGAKGAHFPRDVWDVARIACQESFSGHSSMGPSSPLSEGCFLWHSFSLENALGQKVERHHHHHPAVTQGGMLLV